MLLALMVTPPLWLSKRTIQTVIIYFLAHFLREYKKLFPNQPFIELADRRAFLVRNDYKDQLGITNPNEVYEQEGWFFNLPPVEGAIETFKWLNEREDVEVVICSSPCTNYKASYQLDQTMLDTRAPNFDPFSA